MDNLAFSIPFAISNGKIQTTVDTPAIWRNRVSAVLNGRFSERVMRPDFGTHLTNILFETRDVAIDEAERTITIAFNTWLSALNLIDIATKYDPNTANVEVTIRYTLPSGAEDQVTVNTATFNRSGEIV